MPEETQPRITDRKLWERVLYMLFCAIAYSVAEFVVALVAIFQVVCVAVTGGINDRAQQLGRNVATYINELLQFVTFNDERVPFPFSDWPDEAPGASPWRRETPAAPPAPAQTAAPAAPEAPEPEAAGPETTTSEPGTREDGAASAPPPPAQADEQDPDTPSR